MCWTIESNNTDYLYTTTTKLIPTCPSSSTTVVSFFTFPSSPSSKSSSSSTTSTSTNSSRTSGPKEDTLDLNVYTIPTCNVVESTSTIIRTNNDNNKKTKKRKGTKVFIDERNSGDNDNTNSSNNCSLPLTDSLEAAVLEATGDTGEVSTSTSSSLCSSSSSSLNSSSSTGSTSFIEVIVRPQEQQINFEQKQLIKSGSIINCCCNCCNNNNKYSARAVVVSKTNINERETEETETETEIETETNISSTLTLPTKNLTTCSNYSTNNDTSTYCCCRRHCLQWQQNKVKEKRFLLQLLLNPSRIIERTKSKHPQEPLPQQQQQQQQHCCRTPSSTTSTSLLLPAFSKLLSLFPKKYNKNNNNKQHSNNIIDTSVNNNTGTSKAALTLTPTTTTTMVLVKNDTFKPETVAIVTENEDNDENLNVNANTNTIHPVTSSRINANDCKKQQKLQLQQQPPRKSHSISLPVASTTEVITTPANNPKMKHFLWSKSKKQQQQQQPLTSSLPILPTTSVTSDLCPLTSDSCSSSSSSSRSNSSHSRTNNDNVYNHEDYDNDDDEDDDDDVRNNNTNTNSSNTTNNEPDVYGQIHIVETPEMITKCYISFRKEIDILPKSVTESLRYAEKTCPSIACDVEFQYIFIRTDRYNCKMAAHRYSLYWTKRYEIFGEQRGSQPLTVSSLTVDERAIGIYSNFLQILYSQSLRRTIVYASYDKFNKETMGTMACIRALWIIIHAMLDDIDSQRKGMIIIANGNNMSFKLFNIDLIKLFVDHMKGCIPFRLSAYHLINPPMVLKMFYPPISLLLSKRVRKRVLIHTNVSGTTSTNNKNNTEQIRNQLEMKYNLTKDSLPMDIGGTLQWNPDEWIMKYTSVGK